MPNTSTFTTATVDPVSIPAFRVKDANILPVDGVNALFDGVMALRVLSAYIGGDNVTLDEPMPVECRYGCAHMINLLCNDMQIRALDAVRQCSSNALQAMLDAEAKGAGHDHD